ncbi:C-type lectin domain family 4 member A isoform X2 [Falco biarmicus]|uniref:C-type lectin domain family 4 member A-like n=1 Tax=Falco rusticolus TaxID=120794 RepID=UPI00067997F6|nr:C-type lectin domain family 4 member A isoform X2 [Falco peregrinus]XP_027670798.2 C-type lectin domain family 4 member A isoform X2 [Falco cherrug]XP_037243728.1 C-type lectin domain family 4 member A-like [Falco rusticolus]XP_037243729.1 C-type lectin domain family 4 member A-like [Falco rusticolus]XP_037243730.1 C-type lectin domain family 4 member A-like [Falco rusticolus]XP_056197530.1 C-type lectin domain family 4 member A isoform X2 [Falco biarmicus]
MASEVTYAEVKFKNVSPAAVVKVPLDVKKRESHPQKYPLWLPWLTSLLLLLVCIALVVVLFEGGLTCCPKGWKRFQGSCYYLSTGAMSWDDSKQNCTGMGSHLVVINSEAEQDFLSSELRQISRTENYYIGLSAQEVGQWRWVDQTPFNVTAAFWRKDEPSNKDDQKCVVMHKFSPPPNNWNDVKCERHHRICEAAAVTV